MMALVDFQELGVTGLQVDYSSLSIGETREPYERDVAHFTLPFDRHIDVDWLDGEYVVTLYGQNFDAAYAVNTVKSPYEVIETVRRFAQQYQQPLISYSCSGNSTVIHA